MMVKILFFLSFICTNAIYAQKQKTLTIGAVSDFPISEKLYYNYGVGAEASLIINTPNAKNFIFTLSALKYQFYIYSFPSTSLVQLKKIDNRPFIRTTIGKLIKVNEKIFFNLQGGFGMGDAGRTQSSYIQPTFLAGPTFILPIREKYCTKLHGSFGYFAGGIFVNVGAAFGFKF